ncbi:hypothetical protein [Peribacillus sp. NPDC060253]|uniref:hypothetical protein n=1 Tax=Peribacillus sp. NPDC060253 TaxID=3347084 RepID=UPI003664054D
MYRSQVEYNGIRGMEHYKVNHPELERFSHHRFCDLEFTLHKKNHNEEVEFGGTMQKCLAGSVWPCDIG